MAATQENLLLIAGLAVGLYPQSFTRDRVAALRTLRNEGRNYSENASQVDDDLAVLVDREHLTHDPAEDRLNDRYVATQKLLAVFEGKSNIAQLTEPLVQQYKFTEPSPVSY